jgi:hypothetical protein
MKKYIIPVLCVLVLLTGYAGATGVFVRFAGSDTVYKAYQTAQQFFDDGGAKDFSNVQVVGQEQSFGSISAGSEYNSTTTDTGMVDGILKNGSGSVGNVVITKAGAAGGVWALYDATTTDAFLRTRAATTTIAVFPTDLVAGTYVFDRYFSTGLYLDYISSMGTTSIMWR